MLDIILERLRQKHRTMKYPNGDPPPLPQRFRGRPKLAADRPSTCGTCAACPMGALAASPYGACSLDMGKCIFCGACQDACPAAAVSFGKDYQLAAAKREDLIVSAAANAAPPPAAMDGRLRKLLGRSLKLRQVSAGGCNACEADTNVLGTVGWDLGRFGISFVASPRHADGLLITGPVTQNMKLALEKTYAATPRPKIVIAVGACAISGGIYAGHGEVVGGADKVVPVDLYIPGCPPHPLTILDGLLRLLGRIK